VVNIAAEHVNAKRINIVAMWLITIATIVANNYCGVLLL